MKGQKGVIESRAETGKKKKNFGSSGKVKGNRGGGGERAAMSGRPRERRGSE